MNHTLTGPDERWQREIERRVAERLQHARQDREEDEIRIARLRQAIPVQMYTSPETWRGVRWAIVLTAAAIALIAGSVLVNRIHF